MSFVNEKPKRVYFNASILLFKNDASQSSSTLYD